MIARARAGSNAAMLDKAVSGNAPFELKPGENHAGKQKAWRRGILLTHGLSDSPYFMRHLAVFFQQQGFRVMAVLLPGHGTCPGDLLDVRWQEWARTVAYGVEQLAQEAEEIYLGGYSAGGALSIFHSQLDPRVRGLFLFSPALQISPRAAFANCHKIYSWLVPSAQWLSILPDADLYKYESFTKNAAAQMYALTRAVRGSLARGRMQLPVFAVASQDDVTVDTAATVAFMADAPHSANRLVYYFSDRGKIAADTGNGKTELVSGIFPAQKIISSAHTAIVLPAEDTYYGTQGEYRNCLHYCFDEMEKYAVCQQCLEPVMQGEITEKNLKSGVIRRLMYNPNFNALKDSMQQFIGSLPD